MEPLRNLLPQTLHRFGLAPAAQAALVTHRAQEWLTTQFPQLHGEIVVQHVKDQELIIACGHPAIAQEVMACAEELLQFLAADSAPLLRRIRVEKMK